MAITTISSMSVNARRLGSGGQVMLETTGEQAGGNARLKRILLETDITSLGYFHYNRVSDRALLARDQS